MPTLFDIAEVNTGDFKVSIDKLRIGHYHPWSFRVQRVLMAKGLWEAVLSSGDDSTDARSLDLLIHHLHDRDLSLAMNCTTGKQLWDKLRNQYANNSPAAQLNMRQQLFSMKQLKNEGAQEWGNRITEQYNKHQAAGIDTSEADVCQVLLKGVTPPFHTVRDTLLVTSSELVLEKIITALISYEQMILTNKNSSYDNSQDSAYLVSNTNRRFDRKPARRHTPAARFENSSRPPQQTRPSQQTQGPQQHTTRPEQQSHQTRPQPSP